MLLIHFRREMAYWAARAAVMPWTMASAYFRRPSTVSIISASVAFLVLARAIWIAG